MGLLCERPVARGATLRRSRGSYGPTLIDLNEILLSLFFFLFVVIFLKKSIKKRRFLNQKLFSFPIKTTVNQFSVEPVSFECMDEKKICQA